MRQVTATHHVIPSLSSLPPYRSLPPLPSLLLVLSLIGLAIPAMGCSGRASGSCGNALRDGAETCDSADLDSHVCLSQGFHGGTLTCSQDCRSFDTSGCCMNDCTEEMSSECDGDLHRICEIQENGCLGCVLPASVRKRGSGTPQIAIWPDLTADRSAVTVVVAKRGG